MDIVEKILLDAVGHTDEEQKCPFCPVTEYEGYKTYPESAGKSAVLAGYMEKPEEVEGSGRPKDGKEGKDKCLNQTPRISAEAQKEPAPIFKDEEFGVYTSEAHHLISGNQALIKSAFLKWIQAEPGKAIAHDTGYSVNNGDNGIHLPSIPEKYRIAKNWSGLAPETKLTAASRVMAATRKQFHIGHHHIVDYDDPDGHNKAYDVFLRSKLAALSDRMADWKQACAQTKEKSKPQPTVKANIVLDKLSMYMRSKVFSRPSSWNVFLSRYALKYRNQICQKK